MKRGTSATYADNIAAATKAAGEYADEHYDELSGMRFKDIAETIANEVMEDDAFYRIALNIGIGIANNFVLEDATKDW